MTSRMVWGLALTVGAGTLMAAAFTQTVAVSPAPTAQAGTHATHKITSNTFGLIPSSTLTKPKPVTNNSEELYDYIDPCLIPLSEIRAITGNYRLKFDDGHGGMTTSVAHAGAIQLSDPILPKVCTADPEPGYVKPMVFVGVKTQQSTKQFAALPKHFTNGDPKFFGTESVDIGGLPSAREAFMLYSRVNGQRYPFELYVHTKYNQIVVVKWSGTRAAPAAPVLRQLAYEALRTLDGSRYPGK